jgi:hypothetical protein
MTEVAQIYGLLFLNVPVMYWILQKWVGPNFGRPVHKLIWPPWIIKVHQ